MMPPVTATVLAAVIAVAGDPVRPVPKLPAIRWTTAGGGGKVGPPLGPSLCTSMALACSCSVTASMVSLSPLSCSPMPTIKSTWLSADKSMYVAHVLRQKMGLANSC